MEPVSTSLIGVAIWEYALKPVVDSIRKEYGEETKKLLKSSLNKAFEKLPFQKKELELIETEIVEADISILTDEKKFLEFFEKNKQISDVIIESNSRNKNIDIKVEKGVGYIETMNGDISF
ncbi:MAG TPA: hypothetical protein ENK66_04885 [Arcobacter sp.]|nr:hypothetical protein [Arcobacter sp.]